MENEELSEIILGEPEDCPECILGFVVDSATLQFQRCDSCGQFLDDGEAALGAGLWVLEAHALLRKIAFGRPHGFGKAHRAMARKLLAHNVEEGK